jgi:hypothetical protein
VSERESNVVFIVFILMIKLITNVRDGDFLPIRSIDSNRRLRSH